MSLLMLMVMLGVRPPRPPRRRYEAIALQGIANFGNTCYANGIIQFLRRMGKGVFADGAFQKRLDGTDAWDKESMRDVNREIFDGGTLGVQRDASECLMRMITNKLVKIDSFEFTTIEFKYHTESGAVFPRFMTDTNHKTIANQLITSTNGITGLADLARHYEQGVDNTGGDAGFLSTQTDASGNRIRQVNKAFMHSMSRFVVVYLSQTTRNFVLDTPVTFHTGPLLKSETDVEFTGGGTVYNLVAVACFQGQAINVGAMAIAAAAATLESVRGHYVCYVKVGNTWHLANDSNTTDTGKTDVEIEPNHTPVLVLLERAGP